MEVLLPRTIASAAARAVGNTEVAQEGVARSERKHGKLAFASGACSHEAVDDLGGGSITADRKKAPATVAGCAPRKLGRVLRFLGKRDLQR